MGSHQQSPELGTGTQRWLQNGGWLLAQLKQRHVPQISITPSFRRSSSSSNIWLFKPGLSILGEMLSLHPEEEGLNCQGFAVAALQLYGGDGGLEGVGKGDGHSGVG